MRLIFLLVFVLTATTVSAADTGYHIIKRLRLGGEGGWDYLTADSYARRLYVSRGTHVTVVDLDTGMVVGEIPNTPGVHGIAIAPELNRGFTSDGQTNSVTVFDLKTLQVSGRLKTGEEPDAIVYDPKTKHVFTFNGSSQDATVIGPISGRIIRTIRLGGTPEYAVADGKGRIYVNIEDRAEVAVIETPKARVLRRISLGACKEPTGLALDSKQGRLFAGCRNKLLTVVDIKEGKVIGTVPIGEHVDGNGFDPKTGLAFSSNGDGTLTIARETAPKHYEVVETVPTQQGARTMAIDRKTGYIYLPVARFEPAAPGERPKIVPGTFELLVVGK